MDKSDSSDVLSLAQSVIFRAREPVHPGFAAGLHCGINPVDIPIGIWAVHPGFVAGLYCGGK
ncbi:hypothetical protein ACIBP6_05485 [Nonomuraea terrae]|uniref:hypothetical protein n=1 Tax=Nonomuraea terrae TaxID=2530383 RepID=UPI00378D754B